MNTIKFPDEVNKTPQTPGVYQFKNESGEIIYIGKAKNLKNRIRSYTALTLLPKTARMVSEAKTLTYIEVQSEFEALLLEAKLVRYHMPLFNIELKDDKSPLYIVITDEEYPRVLTFRQTDLKNQKLKYEFGPYVDGRSAKYVLKMLRRIFPFSQHKISKRACIYNEIGLCNPCPSAIMKEVDLEKRTQLRKEYLKNIKLLRMVLSGKVKHVSLELEKEMQLAAKAENFEKAYEIKIKLDRLLSITAAKPVVSEYIKDPNFLSDLHQSETKELKVILNNYIKAGDLNRIECFDIAHLSGSNPTASMVVFIDGQAEPSLYRHFKIKRNAKQNNDVLSMKEVLERRIKHFADWGKPDLILIDGGKPQIAAASEVLNNLVPFTGIAKRYETLVFKVNDGFVEKLLPEGPAKNLVVRLRNEAHRFARRLHHNLVTKTLLGEK